MFNGYDFIDELAEAAWGCDGHYPSSSRDTSSYSNSNYVDYRELLNIYNFKIKFIQLFEPKAYLEGQEEKYSCTVLIPKSNLIAKKEIDDAIKKCIKKAEYTSKYAFYQAPFVKTPIYDGDGLRPNGKPFSDDCKGHWVFTAYNKKEDPPRIPNEMKEKIKEEATIKNALFVFYPYRYNNNYEIAVNIASIYKEYE